MKNNIIFGLLALLAVSLFSCEGLDKNSKYIAGTQVSSDVRGWQSSVIERKNIFAQKMDTLVVFWLKSGETFRIKYHGDNVHPTAMAVSRNKPGDIIEWNLSNDGIEMVPHKPGSGQYAPLANVAHNSQKNVSFMSLSSSDKFEAIDDIAAKLPKVFEDSIGVTAIFKSADEKHIVVADSKDQKVHLFSIENDKIKIEVFNVNQ